VKRGKSKSLIFRTCHRRGSFRFKREREKRGAGGVSMTKDPDLREDEKQFFETAQLGIWVRSPTHRASSFLRRPSMLKDKKQRLN